MQMGRNSMLLNAVEQGRVAQKLMYTGSIPESVGSEQNKNDRALVCEKG